MGSAGPATSWVLIERRESWPRAIADDPLFADGAARQLLLAANRRGTRVLFIRRHGRRDPAATPRLGVVSQRLARAWWREQGDDDFDAAAELVDRLPTLDPDDDPPGWRAGTEDELLVCAHAQHDPCCAVRGRAVTKALAEGSELSTWECSHLGGDRFAGNLLILPEGVLYGGLDADTALPCLSTHRAGGLDVEHLRGIGGLPPYVNAALARVWSFWPHSDRSRLRVTEHCVLEPGTWHVEVAVPGAVVSVQVRSVRQPAVPLTCHAAQPSAPGRLDTDIVAVDRPFHGGHP